MPQVTLYTTTDADFKRTFGYVTRYPAWDASTFYAIGDHVDHAGKAWIAAATSLNVEPGTNPTDWTVATRPAVDLTGSALRLQARRTAGDPEALLDLAVGTGITIETPATAGRFTIAIALGLLADMPPANYVFALTRTVGGIAERVMSGTIAHDQGTVR